MHSPVSAITPYSKEFFDQLRYSDLPSLSLPPILSNGTLAGFVWLDASSAPATSGVSNTAFAFDEHIPSNLDLKPIISQLDVHRSCGYHSVCLRLQMGGSSEIRHIFP